MPSTRMLTIAEASLTKAAALIADGQCVAAPTETVYGLAADATNGQAVAGIYAAKGRPSFNPLIVHVSDLAAAEQIAVFSDAARALAAAHWPGPLTLVLPLKTNQPRLAEPVEAKSTEGQPLPYSSAPNEESKDRPSTSSGRRRRWRSEWKISSLVTAGLPTIALRVPAHPAMQALLAKTGKPLAAPSANASGGISPTRAEHVLKSLGGRIPLILDGGPTQVGLESTIVAVSADGTLRLLRPGPVDLGLAVATSGKIEAPGQLASHYAPAKPLRLNAETAEPDEWLIGFDAIPGDATLSASGNLTEAAARLFDALHEADASPKPRIAIAPIRKKGLGVAINDRLRRAAA